MPKVAIIDLMHTGHCCMISVPVSYDQATEGVFHGGWRRGSTGQDEPTARSTIQVRSKWHETKATLFTPSTGWPAGPTFPTFPYFLIQSPTFPYFLRNQPYYPYFLGCHVVNFNKEHLKLVFLHWFSTKNLLPLPTMYILVCSTVSSLWW